MHRILQFVLNNTLLSLLATALSGVLGLAAILTAIPESDANNAQAADTLEARQAIALQSPYQAEEWIRQVIEREITTRPYQVAFQRLDLDADGVAEILVSKAPPMRDVYIPDRRLHVLEFGEQGWRATESDTACRPERLGEFRTNGFWDLLCRDGDELLTLRWDGQRYRAGI